MRCHPDRFAVGLKLPKRAPRELCPDRGPPARCIRLHPNGIGLLELRSLQASTARTIPSPFSSFTRGASPSNPGSKRLPRLCSFRRPHLNCTPILTAWTDVVSRFPRSKLNGFPRLPMSSERMTFAVLQNLAIADQHVPFNCDRCDTVTVGGTCLDGVQGRWALMNCDKGQ